MKKLFVAVAILLSSSLSFASSDEGYLEYSCVQTHTDSSRPLWFSLVAEKAGRVLEGVPAGFVLRVYSGDAERPFLTKRVIVEVEDVTFDFATTDKSISGRIYLDELDQTSLNLGKHSYRFDCDFED